MLRIVIILITTLTALSAQLQYKDEKGIFVPKNWKSDRPYWDMPVIPEYLQFPRNLEKILNDYQFNPFHQPNEIYGKETCHGGGDGTGEGLIDRADINAADLGTNHFALDTDGNNIVNGNDATEIQNYIDNVIPYLQSHWNFLSESEKESWFMKMANIYTVDQKQYIEGDENSRYISGNFATEFILRMQGYDPNKLDLAGGTRQNIPTKYNESLTIKGRSNIPVYFGYISGQMEIMDWIFG